MLLLPSLLAVCAPSRSAQTPLHAGYVHECKQTLAPCHARSGLDSLLPRPHAVLVPHITTHRRTNPSPAFPSSLLRPPPTLQGRRPLIPADMPLTPEVKEVLDTFKVSVAGTCWAGRTVGAMCPKQGAEEGAVGWPCRCGSEAVRPHCTLHNLSRMPASSRLGSIHITGTLTHHRPAPLSPSFPPHAQVAAQLGRGSLGAYVISMTKGASDVLAVELLQREARMHVRGEETGRQGGSRASGERARGVRLGLTKWATLVAWGVRTGVPYLGRAERQSVSPMWAKALLRSACLPALALFAGVR